MLFLGQLFSALHQSVDSSQQAVQATRRTNGFGQTRPTPRVDVAVRLPASVASFPATNSLAVEPAMNCGNVSIAHIFTGVLNIVEHSPTDSEVLDDSCQRIATTRAGHEAAKDSGDERPNPDLPDESATVHIQTPGRGRVMEGGQVRCRVVIDQAHH